jgi:four helix bundle protein
LGSYENLKVWQKSHEFVLSIYKSTKDFPKEEKYGLVSQLRRAAASIPTNIAEGKGSYYNKKLIRFLDVARGSAHEVEYLLLLCKDLGYFTDAKYNSLSQDCNYILRMLTNFIKNLKEDPKN